MAFPKFILFIYFIYLKFGLEPHQERTDNAEEVHGREPTNVTELAPTLSRGVVPGSTRGSRSLWVAIKSDVTMAKRLKSRKTH